MDVCGKPMRGGGTCQHDAGHRGAHSTVVFRCDHCEKTRRGRPHAWGRDGEYEHGLAICFMCARGLTAEPEPPAHTHVHTIKDGKPVCVYCGEELEL